MTSLRDDEHAAPSATSLSTPGRRRTATDRLFLTIIGEAVLLMVLFIVLYAVWGTSSVIDQTAWYVPLLHSFTGLAALSVGFLAFGRYKVLRDTVSYWICVGFTSFAILSLFYILTWPGLGSNGLGIIAKLPNTSGWIGVLELSSLSLSLLAAALARWPGEQALAGRRLDWSVAAWILGITLIASLSVVFEQSLPSLIGSGGSLNVSLLVIAWILLILFVAGSVLSTRRYLVTGDTLLGYVAIAQIATAFVLVTTLISSNRLAVWSDLSRVLQALGSLALMFGLLFEYVQLYRLEKERSIELMVAEEALKESEAKYRGLFANMKETVTLRKFVYDDHGEVVDQILIDANPAALESFGVRSLDEVKGKRYSEMNGPEQLNEANQRIKLLRSTGVPISREVHMESNDRYYLRTSALLGTEQVIATGVDITETKRALKEAEAYAKNLRKSNEELQQFAYVASHDLQEPLRMVISYLSLLDKKYKSELDSQAKDYIDHAVDGGARMRRLIDDLLEFSRIETRADAFAQVNMRELIESTIKLLKVQIGESKADIYIEPMPTIMADGPQIQQVMQNLISNAIKFHGPERPMVHISAREGTKEWTFSVKDNGIGLNVEYADKIFQMFQRLHTIDQYPGTGVGLAIVKKIVERHGGRIWVESEEGRGATFFFTIPKK
jgi:signal transduction histidine kinase